MKRMLSLLTIGLVFCLTSGCALFGDKLDEIAKGAGELVSFYCENVTVPEIRDQIRSAVNQHAAPHSVNVTCAQGGPSLQSTTL